MDAITAVNRTEPKWIIVLVNNNFFKKVPYLILQINTGQIPEV